MKSIKGVKARPYRGYYRKIAHYIIDEFQKGKHKHAEVELEYDRERELYSLYQAIKSLIKRSNPQLNIKCSVNKRERKLHLRKGR